nr:MAG TPA: ISL3 zinc-finger of transposase IS204/IS1001/IS1096/IS1165 [Caudoviricetes sp.]
MNVYEMEGFLRGKCLPSDIKVNESNAEYLVRKLNAASELEDEVTALVATLEKCREITNCPAGVDLQDHLRQLVADSVQQRISELESPTLTFEVTVEPFTCPRCGTTTTHPEGWHYCHKREGE